MGVARLFLVVALLALASGGAVARRSSSATVATFPPTPTPTPSPTPWVFTGCKRDEQAASSGPWDDVTRYDDIVPGSLASDLYCGGLEICFAIDESGSMRAENFEIEIQFVRKLVAKMVQKTHIAHPGNYSAWLFDDDSEGEIDQIAAITANYHSVLAKLNDAFYDGGCTNIAAGLRNCAKELSVNPRGSQKAIVVITDGAQSVDANGDGEFIYHEEDSHVLDMAREIESQGVSILTLELYMRSLGRDEKFTQFLQDLASKRSDSSPRFFQSDFQDLVAQDILADLMSGADGLCDPEIVGPIPADVFEFCQCTEMADGTGTGEALKPVEGSVNECQIVQNSAALMVCDESGDQLCRLEETIGYVYEDSTSRSSPLPNGNVRCTTKTVVKTVATADH